jgi:hypothetical protein
MCVKYWVYLSYKFCDETERGLEEIQH